MVLEFTNCQVLREGRFIRTSMWVDGGKVVEAGAGQGVVEQVARGGGTTG